MESNEEKVTAINISDILNTLHSQEKSDPKLVSSELAENAMQTETTTTEKQVHNIPETSVNFAGEGQCDMSINTNHSIDKQACGSDVTSSYEVNIDCSHDKMVNTTVNMNMSCESECENKNICDQKEGKSIDECDKTSNNKNNRKSKSSEQTPAVTDALSQLLEYGMSDSEDSESDSVSISDSSDTNSEVSAEIANKTNTNNKSDICDADKFRENDSSSDSSTYYDSDSSSERLVLM